MPCDNRPAIMRTLASELGAALDARPRDPRVYADANVPRGLVGFMREQLRWDVFFVMEHDDLRRAADVEHFRLARQMHRTLVTLDRDYTDDHRFPPAEGAGVIVVSAPGERLQARVLRRVDRFVMRGQGPSGTAPAHALPLAGRKLHVDLDWHA
jgi:hypothetical protein